MRKILDIQLDGHHLAGYLKLGDNNPFRLFRVCAGHRQQIAKYGDFMSIIIFIKDYYQYGADSMTMHDAAQWARDYHAGKLEV